MLIRDATPADLPIVLKLLAAVHLPTAGAEEHLSSFRLAEEGEVVGLAGLEVHDDVGLLRSVAVAPTARGQGIAARLVDEVIE
ncbi:GNAT family N-acetyltransferase [Deinococcus sp. KSM4-11]|uniref:GNAT family N-acetyltransferase n=1 Tax=Deinococcus sp. KSM4-11 TaxID=2568654 RepID=UPI0010A34991|nr:GNAT family N-acetyltransferase [Deinococcus sp. KSM4-11]THF86750.1 GNAT family N-acetyltransferase [Deinococcus sp. KSM4-11]